MARSDVQGGERGVGHPLRLALMQVSARISKLPGVRQASAVMASANNLGLLREAGLLQKPVEASPNDLLIALDGDDEKSLATALEDAESALNRQPAAGAGDARAGRCP